jgi:PAS domain S-box-containing protein
MDVIQPAVLNVEHALASASDGVFMVDSRRRFAFFNPACERLIGCRQAEVVGQECPRSDVPGDSGLATRSFPRALGPSSRLFAGTVPVESRVVTLTRSDGSSVAVQVVFLALHNGTGAVNGVLGFVRRAEQETVGGAGAAQPGSTSREPHALDEILESVEREAILSALRSTGGQRTRAAARMRISRSRLYRRLEALGIGYPERA